MNWFKNVLFIFTRSVDFMDDIKMTLNKNRIWSFYPLNQIITVIIPISCEIYFLISLVYLPEETSWFIPFEILLLEK